MHMKITRRTQLLVVALVLCFTTMIGSTFAWFTDSVDSGVNTITAGNLDMKVSYKPYGATNTTWTEVKEDTKIFAENALYEPGYTEAIWLKIENAGNLAFRYQTALNILLETKGTNKAGQRFSLSDYLVVKSANVTDVEGWEAFYTTRDSLNSFAFKEIPLNADSLVMTSNSVMTNDAEAQYVLVVLQMPTTVGNEANHNGNAPSIKLGLNVTATQVPSESDSFGTDYDKDAEYPAIKYEVRKLNAGHNVNSTISTSVNYSPIVAVNPKIYGCSVFEGDTRITDAVIFRFSDVAKTTIDENSYKVSFNLAILDDEGKDLELKPGMPSTINGKEYLYVYLNLIEIPSGYAVSAVKVNDTDLTKTTNSDPATEQYMLGSEAKDVYLQTKEAGLIEIIVSKTN